MAFTYNDFLNSTNTDVRSNQSGPNINQSQTSTNGKARPTIEEVQNKTGGAGRNSVRTEVKKPGLAKRAAKGAAKYAAKGVRGYAGFGAAKGLGEQAIRTYNDGADTFSRLQQKYAGVPGFGDGTQPLNPYQAAGAYALDTAESMGRGLAGVFGMGDALPSDQAINQQPPANDNPVGSTFEQSVANTSDIPYVPTNDTQPQSAQPIRNAQDPNHSIARTDFNQPDINYDFSQPGSVRASVTDSRGNTGSLTAPESLVGNQRGTFSTYSAADALSDPRAKALARQAATGEISTAQYNAGLRQLNQQVDNGGQSTLIADKIAQLENELSTPGRGANQSISDMLSEARNRKNKRKALDELYGLQKQQMDSNSASQIAGAKNRSAERIANQKNIVERNKSIRSETNKALKEQRRIYEKNRDFVASRVDANAAKQTAQETRAQQQMDKDSKVFEAEADRQIASGRMTPEERPFYVANLESKGYSGKGNYFETPRGKIARAAIADEFLKLNKKERGLIDWIGNAFGFAGKEMTKEDLYNLDFSKLEFNDKGEGAQFWVNAARLKDSNKPANYVYHYNMPEEFKILLRRLIDSDTKKAASLRSGQ